MKPMRLIGQRKQIRESLNIKIYQASSSNNVKKRFMEHIDKCLQ